MITLPGRTFIARHGETVFNASRRIQSEITHTPLTRAGFAQADAMGAALEKLLSEGAPITLWSSPTGRALQTLAVIAEHLGEDWHEARHDARLGEFGMAGWDGRRYDDLIAEYGPIFDASAGVFIATSSDGESYAQLAERLRDWVSEQNDDGDRLIVMHGVSSAVLRALLVGGDPHPKCGTPVAKSLPQGSVVMIENGRERIVVRGTGR